MEIGYSAGGNVAYLQGWSRTTNAYVPALVVGSTASVHGNNAQGMTFDTGGTATFDQNIVIKGVEDIALLGGTPPGAGAGKLRLYGAPDGKLHCIDASGTDHALW